MYTIEINKRFFQAFEALTQTGMVSLKSFCERYSFSRAKYSRLRSRSVDPSKEIDYKSIDVAAIGYIINDYNVSPDWIFKGKGPMFKRQAI